MKRLKLLLKFAFVSGLLYLLARKGFISIEATARAFSRLDLILPAMAILFFTTFLTIIRWQWLLRGQSIELPFLRTLQLAMVGSFFNIALPGAVSGDFVKAFYIAREVQGQRARAFGSILFDRVAGLSALSILAAGALVFSRTEISGSGLFPAIRLIVLAPGLSFVVFYAYLFLVREHHDPVLRVLKALQRGSPARGVLGSLLRIYESLRHYHNHRWTVLRVLALSIGIHFLVCIACLLFLTALGDGELASAPMFIAVPIGLLFTAIPIAPAGVGTGHAAFGWLFQFLGSARGADVFSLFALTQLLLGALGGVVYLRFRSHEPKPVLDDPNEALSSV